MGKYDNITTFCSREIINAVKSDMKRGKIQFPFETADTATEIISLQYKIKTTKKYKFSHAIEAEFFNDKIKLDITINKSYFPASYNMLISELKEAIRHEIEHAAQEHLERPQSETHEYLKGAVKDNYAKYLTLRHEVPAFVRGLYKSAKTQKVTMNKVVADFFQYYSLEIPHQSQQEVIAIWFDYAKKHLPCAKWI